MITSILSLLLLVLPGYSIFHMKWIKRKIDFSEVDKFLFGFIIWIFYIVSTVLRANIAYPNYLKYIFWFNYFLGIILVGYWLFTEIPGVKFNLSNYQVKINLINITLGGTLPFLLPIIAFIVVITLYTPLIYQYDALAMYLFQGRQLIDGSSSLAGAYPTFGGSMPVMPILYSWFFHLSDAPILRLIPLLLFFLMILLVYSLGRKLFPENPQASYISLVSLVSMTALQRYMAKTSLSTDLIFVFLSALSIYLLIHIIENRATRITYLILGINLALLMLSKEFGIFHTWFVISILIFSYYLQKHNNWIWLLTQSAFLLAPLIVYQFGLTFIFTFFDLSKVGQVRILRLFLLVLFLLIFFFVFRMGNLQVERPNLSKIIIFVMPLFLPVLFFTNNFLTLGTPFSSFKALDIQRLLKLGITFPTKGLGSLSLLNLLDPFFINTFIATNLVPFLTSILVPFMPRFKNSSSKLPLLLSWFFYWLFIIYFKYLGQFEAGESRRILYLAIPFSLMVGNGVHYLTRSYRKSSIGTITYTSVTSLSLAYLWFIKLDGSKWWLPNLHSLTTNLAKANYLEIFIYALPWLFLTFFITVGNKWLNYSRIYSKKYSSIIFIVFLLISAITPIAIFSQSLSYVKTWNPSYYDEADSAKSYANHWYMPILDYYRSRLNDDSTTIGFGVTPLEYFLERPFIELNHPRNWLMYLPLFQELSTDALISYLESLDARYFLIPTEKHGGRNRYEAALKNSTLFKLISTSEVFTGTEGQMFYFERLAEFRPLVLYVLTQLPDWIPIDMEAGEFYTAQDYDNYGLFFDKTFKQNVVLYRLNASLTGWRALHYIPNISLDLSNVDTIILAIKSNLKFRTMLFRLECEIPWKNRLGWRFYYDTENWKFYEFNLSEPNPDVVKGKFDPTQVKQLTLGLTVKLNDPEDIQIYYFILLPDRS